MTRSRRKGLPCREGGLRCLLHLLHLLRLLCLLHLLCLLCLLHLLSRSVCLRLGVLGAGRDRQEPVPLDGVHAKNQHLVESEPSSLSFSVFQ